MSLEQKITSVFDSGYHIRFENVVKRMDGDWHQRIIWTHVQNPSSGYVDSCEWEGFETIEECVDDCLKYIEKHNSV